MVKKKKKKGTEASLGMASGTRGGVPGEAEEVSFVMMGGKETEYWDILGILPRSLQAIS